MLIRELPNNIIVGHITYIARVCGEQRVDGTWRTPISSPRWDSTTHRLKSERRVDRLP